MSTNKVNFVGATFLASAATANHEYGMVMPLNWNGGAVAASPYFYTGSALTTGTVGFGIQARGFNTGDNMDAAYCAAATSTYTLGASIQYKIIMGPLVTITPAGTPTGGYWVQWKVFRAGEDTFAGDVVLLGWLITYTTDNWQDK
jgi:hypothetical protein